MRNDTENCIIYDTDVGMPVRVGLLPDMMIFCRTPTQIYLGQSRPGTDLVGLTAL